MFGRLGGILMVFFGWLGVRRVLAGGVLLAMQNTDFSIVSL